MTLTTAQLDEMERVAREATQGKWIASANLVRRLALAHESPHITEVVSDKHIEDAAHIAAFNPENAMRLIELARKGLK